MLLPPLLWHAFFAKRRLVETDGAARKMGEACGAWDLAEMLEGSESEWGSENGDKKRVGATRSDMGSQGLLVGAASWWRNGKMLRPSKPNDEPCDVAANAPRQGVPSMRQQ